MFELGGIASRAEDERAAISCGYPGQETTGPGGVAMGQRTIPVAIAQARLVERLAPEAWLINFTNPAGLITQAMQQHSGAKIVGICDTPTEMIHRIQTALGASAAEVECEYVGLNHLGWFRRIVLRGEDVTARLLEDDGFLSQLYSAPLFDHELIRALGLIPTEYLFFYYSRRRALENQLKQGSTRGEEIARMNESLMTVLARSNDANALRAYIEYLNVRSGSYMKLEGEGTTAFDAGLMELDPFRAASGYHRIALDVMNGLVGTEETRVIVNTRNGGTIPEIEAGDTVEALSVIQNGRIAPLPVGPLPESVRGLVLAVKAYERVGNRGGDERQRARYAQGDAAEPRDRGVGAFRAAAAVAASALSELHWCRRIGAGECGCADRVGGGGWRWWWREAQDASRLRRRRRRFRSLTSRNLWGSGMNCSGYP